MRVKLKENIKRIAALFFLAMLCIVTLWGEIIPAPLAYAESNRDLEFDETNVMDDLAGATIDGKPFNLLNYPFYPSVTPEMYLVGVIEYCYAYTVNANGNYGLYLYMYNPNGLDIDTGSDANVVLMAVDYDTYPITEESKPTKYEEFNLKFCSTVESGSYKHLFYKFRVVDHESADGKTVRDRVNSNGRRYDISGFELQMTDGSVNDFGVGGSYIFTGYTKGYGPDENAESDLDCKVNDLETVEVQTTSTFYRTGEYKKDYQHDLTSVYFAVPSRFFDDYGGLQKVKADWYEYVTTPIVITSNSEVLSELKPWIGKDIGTYNDDVPLSLYTGYQRVYDGVVPFVKYDWVYNADPVDTHRAVANTYCERLNWLFSTNGADISEYVLSSARLQEYVDTYDKSHDEGNLPIPGKQINGDLFEDGLSADRAAVDYVGNDIHHKQFNFDANEEFDMLNYDDSNSGWIRFFNALFGFAPSDVDQSYKGISPIHIVTDDDMAQPDIAKNLLIDGRDEPLQKFRDFYNTSVKDNDGDGNPDNKVVLLRFAQTDFMRLPVMAYNHHTGTNLDKQYGKSTYVVQESVFYNFDVLELTFNDKGVYTVIPVVNDPIDIFNDIQLPAKDGMGLLEIILLVLGLIVLLVVLMPILPYIIKAVVWVIMLPFRLIAAIVKGIQKAAKKKPKQAATSPPKVQAPQPKAVYRTAKAAGKDNQRTANKDRK